MDQAKSRELLLDLKHQLPTGVWCMIRDKNGDTTTMAKMLGRPSKEIDALLINAGICTVRVRVHV